MSGSVVLRLAKAEEVEPSATAGFYAGIPALDNGFIHMSTGAQAQSTAGLYFAGVEDLVLLVFSASGIDGTEGLELKYEDAVPLGGAAQRSGDFPHVYGGSIPWSCLAEEPIPLPWDPDAGAHRFPPAYSIAVIDGKAGE